jgi:glucose/arabinose dehydrogenase/type 1 glutamine amidotransferase
MRWGRRLACTAVAGLALTLPAAAAPAFMERSDPDYRVLVFTGTAGAEHPATDAGTQAIRELGLDDGFQVTAADDSSAFTAANLAGYRVVVLLNNSGDVLSDAQQAALEGFVEAGGGLVAIHAAIEAEPAWQFLTNALGARSTGLSAVQQATVKVADQVHVSSRPLPEFWTGTDRWYDFDKNVRGFQHVLATVDETTYSGGTMGFDHPIAWCQDLQGGRIWYTGRGGLPEAYATASLRDHVLGGIGWAAGVKKGDCGATVLSNYRQTLIAENLVRNGPTSDNHVGEPIGFDVLPDGRVLQTTRGTGILPGQPTPPENIQNAQLWLHAADGTTHTILAEFLVYNNSEDGLYGPAIDKDFATNRWVYLYYSPARMDPPFPERTPPGNAPTFGATVDVWDPWLGYFQLSRFKLVEFPTPHLDLASEQKILKVPVNRGACCHVAGDIAFDSKNNLWLVTGDDTPAGGGNSGGFAPFNDQLTNEIQTVTTAGATGGTFTLTFNGQTTAPITFTPGNAGANNAAVEAALEALSNLDDVTVTGNNQNVRNVDFRQLDVPQMTADGAGLTGTAPTITVATSQPGGLLWAPFVDARRSALNTNDLRGKILRIRVSEDGSYSIPNGNLFRAGTPQTRPEIYAMGFRNPFRIDLDDKDVAYVTDYSPDSRVPENFRGPPGVGRIEIVRSPSSYGWPLCYSRALPYYRWDYVAGRPLDSPAQTFTCGNSGRGPDNTSKWNTGRTETPPVTNPDAWYSFNDNNATPLGTPCFAYYNGSGTTACPQLFPEFGPGGGVGPHGASPYNFDKKVDAPGKFPEYFDGSFIFGEFTRDYLREVRLDSKGRVFKLSNVLNCGPVNVPPQPPIPPTPERPFDCDNPMDMKFGPDGNFYLLTYGDGFFNANADAQLVKFSYVKNSP